jgi:hypothetical protein
MVCGSQIRFQFIENMLSSIYSNYRHCHRLIKKRFNPHLIFYRSLRFVQSSRGDTTSGCALAGFVRRTSIRGSPPKLPPPNSCCPRLIPVALWRRPSPADSEDVVRRPPWDPWTPQRLLPRIHGRRRVSSHRFVMELGLKPTGEKGGERGPLCWKILCEYPIWD